MTTYATLSQNITLKRLAALVEKPVEKNSIVRIVVWDCEDGAQFISDIYQGPTTWQVPQFNSQRSSWAQSGYKVSFELIEE